MESLSKEQASKLVLHSQRILTSEATTNAIDATLAVIEHLGYIQIDTISVIQRAHHHTLWNRNSLYQPNHLESLLADKKIFEYWSHAAAYLPMRDYRYSLKRKQAIANGDEKHWYEKDKKLMQSILKRIETEGPLMAKDFEHKEVPVGEWGSKPAKRALENLFMQGELMIPCRKKFHKVYDLTARVLPKGIDTTLPDDKEYAQFLIIRYLEANGLGQAAEIVYLLKNKKALISSTIQEMLSNKILVKLKVGEIEYVTLPDSLALIDEPLSRARLKILSPFDNLLIQRKRMKAIFDFDYQIECYVPEAKRVYGYFSLPILWNGKLVARIDCKADRKNAILHIKHLALEPSLARIDDFIQALNQELDSFMHFNDCNQIILHKTTPPHLSDIIKI